MWYISPFYKAKVNHNVFIFDYKAWNFILRGKDNSNNNVKSVVNICLVNEFDMWFWCCRGMNSFIFGKSELEVLLIMIDHFIFLNFTLYECPVGGQMKIDHNLLLWDILCRPDIFCWYLLVEYRTNGIPRFLGLN